MSFKSKIYLSVILCSGFISLAVHLPAFHTGDPFRFAAYLILAMLSSSLKVSLPRIDGTMSVLFLILLIGVVDLSLPETLVMGIAAVFVQSFWRAKRRPHLVHLSFNVASLVLAIVTSHFVFMAGAPLGGPWSERVLLHGKADATFHRSGFYARTLSRSLSASNKHPASALRVRDALAALPGPDGLVAEVEAFLHRADVAGAPSGELAWLADPATATVELFAGLGRR